MAISLGPCQVRPRLEGRFGVPLYLFAERCSSTQELLPLDAPEGALAIAEAQTRGRGRRGRSWEAPAGTSLLFSVCLRPEVEAARLPALTIVGADAIAEAIGELISESGLRPVVKPPNDVLLAGKKVAGVVAEASGRRVALGIGVNVDQRAEDLPPRPLYPASSLALELERPPARVDLLVRLLTVLEVRYERWLDPRMEMGAVDFE